MIDWWLWQVWRGLVATPGAVQADRKLVILTLACQKWSEALQAIQVLALDSTSSEQAARRLHFGSGRPPVLLFTNHRDVIRAGQVPPRCHLLWLEFVVRYDRTHLFSPFCVACSWGTSLTCPSAYSRVLDTRHSRLSSFWQVLDSVKTTVVALRAAAVAGSAAPSRAEFMWQ